MDVDKWKKIAFNHKSIGRGIRKRRRRCWKDNLEADTGLILEDKKA
jgi:hypothetical protein